MLSRKLMLCHMFLAMFGSRHDHARDDIAFHYLRNRQMLRYQWVCVISRSWFVPKQLQALPPGLGERLVRLAQTKSSKKLEELLLEEGILCTEQNPSRHLHLDLKKYSQLFQKYSLVSRTPRVLCTCWHFRHKGHCVHAWAAEEFWGIQKHTSTPVPAASMAAPVTAFDEVAAAEEFRPRMRQARG